MRNFKVILSNCFSPHPSYHQVRFLPLTQLLKVPSLAPILPWNPYMIIWSTCL